MKKRFSLIELLIIIVIISILAAMLLPVLNQARERGRAITCLSNLKQCGYAFNQYADIHNGTFPFATAGGATAWAYGGKHGWRPYYELIAGSSLQKDFAAVPMKNLCPKVASYQNVWHDDSGLYPDWTRPSFYGMVGQCADGNEAYIRKGGDLYLHDPMRVSAPSTKVLQAETNNYTGSTNSGIWALAIANSYGAANPTSNARIAYEHNGSANILYFDLHVDSRKASYLNGTYITGNNFKPYMR